MCYSVGMTHHRPWCHDHRKTHLANGICTSQPHSLDFGNQVNYNLNRIIVMLMADPHSGLEHDFISITYTTGINPEPQTITLDIRTTDAIRALLGVALYTHEGTPDMRDYFLDIANSQLPGTVTHAHYRNNPHPTDGPVSRETTEQDV